MGVGGENDPGRGRARNLCLRRAALYQLFYSDWIVHPSVETGVKGVQSGRTANKDLSSEDLGMPQLTINGKCVTRTRSVHP